MYKESKAVANLYSLVKVHKAPITNHQNTHNPRTLKESAKQIVLKRKNELN